MMHSRSNFGLLLGALLGLGICSGVLYAADTTITALPAGSALAGTEAIPADQSGTTVKTTPASLATYNASAAQTLTNKTISGASNTISNVAQSSVTNLTTDLAAKAPLASPALTGTPTAPTAAAGTNTTQVATTAGIVAERAATATLTNKTISGASNTISNVSLTAGVTGTLPVGNGGTGIASAAIDSAIMGSGTTSPLSVAAVPNCGSSTQALAYNTTTHAFGCQTITGSVAGAALTKTDDTNVTLTLGGSPTTALVNAASITAGWSGQLGVTRGGTGLGTAANDAVLMGNGTGAMSAVSVPNCGDSTHALAYSTSTDTWSCQSVTGSGGTPAGSNTQVQFNSSGAFGADADFVWDSTNNKLSLGSTATAGKLFGADTAGAGTVAGGLNIQAGSNTSDGSGGSLTLTGGTGTGSNRAGGDVTVTGGSGVLTAGVVTITAGSASQAGGNGGLATLQGGTASDGNGGGVAITARNGAGTNRNGGSVTFTAGSATGSGTAGTYVFSGTNAATFGGSVTTGSAGLSAARVIVSSGGSVPSNGLYLPGTNRLGFSTNSTQAGEFDASRNFVLTTAGAGLQVKEGSNAKMGTCTLSAGACTVSTTAVTANSRIFLTAQALGTVTTGQGLAVSARTAGTSFTVTSGAPTDTSTVAWFIVEPSP